MKSEKWEKIGEKNRKQYFLLKKVRGSTGISTRVLCLEGAEHYPLDHTRLIQLMSKNKYKSWVPHGQALNYTKICITQFALRNLNNSITLKWKTTWRKNLSSPGFEPGASKIAFTRLDHKTMSSYDKSGEWQCGSNEDRLGNGLWIFFIFCLSTEAMINWKFQHYLPWIKPKS